MDLAEIYHFIFETYAGIGCLVGAGIVISIIAAVISERKTRRVFRDRGDARKTATKRMRTKANSALVLF